MADIEIRAAGPVDVAALYDGPQKRSMRAVVVTVDQVPLGLGGIYYEEEPPGQEDWQDLLTCMKLKASDCEDLACFRAAELRVRHGIMARPTFVHRVRPNGGNLYHVQVQYPDGRIEDPSRVLGMR